MATKAKFDAGDQRRRGLIAKVHVAKKQLGLDDDTYRGALAFVTGKGSASDCTDKELNEVLAHFAKKGFRSRPAGGKAAADHPSARKARALWLSLHHLGVVENPADQALEAFARRQLGTELRWANQAQCYKLVEALKAMGERAGWRQSAQNLGGVDPLLALKYRLCLTIIDRMVAAELVPDAWSFQRVAFDLLGERPDDLNDGWSMGALDRIAAGLGAKLRAAL